MTGSGAYAWLRRGGFAATCLALLIASQLAGASAEFQAASPLRVDCSAASRPALCQAQETATKDKATKSKASKEKVARDKASKDKSKRPQKDAAVTQKALLKSAVDRLAPQRKGTTDLYAIGVAGWADEDVFIKELDGVMASLTNVLPIEGRTMRLVNRADTAKTTPLATRDNIAAAIAAVAQVMDKDEDILLLFMTSHGNRGGFALQLPGRQPLEFAPRDLARILDGAGIRHRIVIVSACYSGIFVPPLANDDTIVITAADARNPSFGCAPGREWTYFGDALFNRSLRPGTDFQRAFSGARITISEWELTDNLAPSNPQGHFGTALVEKLAPLFKGSSDAAR